jgi:hypothetical protein
MIQTTYFFKIKKWSDELNLIAREMAFQNKENEKRVAEPIIASNKSGN